MRDTCPDHLILFALVALMILANLNYEAPHHVIFSVLMLHPLYYVEMFSSNFP
jgi:hypothetical protein